MSQGSPEARLAAVLALYRLQLLLEPRRVALERRLRIAFVVIDDQPYLLDTGMREMISVGWHDQAELIVMSDANTLSDLMAGEFDCDHPPPDGLLLWAGDQHVWGALFRALTGGRSTIALQIEAALGRRR